ncbi:hypothetical protein P775_25325 [Puniceibacterium antarcticum]|uniref:Uncharacterized protein n=1 Tax=Puniceibacterium antarcticum TaxID=1206336 RepID=A0A2G8R422_9RHOB|nr:hypothetical protein P775_25325 [Puniceibacterium antarcticum]
MKLLGQRLMAQDFDIQAAETQMKYRVWKGISDLPQSAMVSTRVLPI